jgi:acetyl-CoA acetyltransferase
LSANVSEATRLGAIAIEAAVRQAGADKAAVEEAYLGVAVQAGLGQAPARQAVIYAGLPVHVVSTTINKVYSFLCLYITLYFSVWFILVLEETVS